MIIVALDVATTVGICVGSPGAKPAAWSVRLGKKGDEDALFSNALRLTWELIDRHKPDLIAYEGAVGGPRTSHFLVGIIANIRGCAAFKGVPAVSYNIGAIRKTFVGQHITSAQYKHLPPAKRKAVARAHAKAAVMKGCQMRGWTAPDEDAADACAIFEHACIHNAKGYQAHPTGGLFA